MLPIEPYTWQRRHPPRPFGTSTAAHRGLHTYQAGSGAVRRSYTRSTPHRSLGAASRDDVYSCKQETADEDLGEPWCGRGHGRRGTPSLKEALRRRGESLTTAERLHAPSQGKGSAFRLITAECLKMVSCLAFRGKDASDINEKDAVWLVRGLNPVLRRRATGSLQALGL